MTHNVLSPMGSKCTRWEIRKFIVDEFKYSELNHNEILWMVARQLEYSVIVRDYS